MTIETLFICACAIGVVAFGAALLILINRVDQLEYEVNKLKTPERLPRQTHHW